MIFRLTRSIFYYSTFLLILASFSSVSNIALHAASHRNEYETKHRHGIATVRKLIANCPSWRGLAIGGANDTSSKREVFKVLDQIAAYDDDVIEASVKQYATQQDGNEFRLSNIYLVTRYLYNVPDTLPLKGLPMRTDFSAVGAPRDKEYIQSMWPLAYREDRLDIVPPPAGIMWGYCPGVVMVDGFKYCRLHYGRRLNRKHI